MREAIEAVIKDLEQRRADTYHDEKDPHNEQFQYGEIYGRRRVLNHVIAELQEVISQHGTDDGGGVSGNVGEEAKQIPSETDSS